LRHTRSLRAIAGCAVLFVAFVTACTNDFGVFDQPGEGGEVDGTEPEAAASSGGADAPPGAHQDAALEDAAADATGADAVAADGAGARDATSDAAIDANADAAGSAADSSPDSSADTAGDAPADVSIDRPLDAPGDGPADAPVDAAAEARADAGRDATADAAPCGDAGQACCANSSCFAAECCNTISGTCIVRACSQCGGSGQVCCPVGPGPRCAPGLNCVGATNRVCQ
jgi:hypothetical protein